LIVSVIVLLGASLALADAPRTGLVTGTVIDPAGAPMPGATVLLMSERGDQSTVSDEGGDFIFSFIIPDVYVVRADLSGFQSAEGEIVVTAGGRAHVDLQLTEQMGEEIVVTAETPMINKFDVAGGGTVDSKELRNIVAGTRVYTSSLQYLPEVELGDGGTNIAGNTGWRTTYYVDGVDTSFARFGGKTQVRLPTLAVGQAQVLSSRADAEFSRTMGGVSSVIVRSGTNDFHGDFSVLAQNLAWNEKYDEFPTDLKDEMRYGFEAALGGPIVKDKLWFFVSAADQDTAAYRVLVSGVQVDTSTEWTPWLAKIDWRPNSRHSIAVTATETPTSFPYWGRNWADEYSGSYFEQSGSFYSARWGWAISDDLFLDTHVADQSTQDDRSALKLHPIDDSAPPWSPRGNNYEYYDILTRQSWNGHALTLGNSQVEYPRTQGNASLNWFMNSHDIKAGIDFQDTRWKVNSRTNTRVVGRGYNPDLPGGFVRPAYNYYYYGPADIGGVENKSETLAIFVRDRISVGSHWTINAGVRGDQQQHWSDAGEKIFDSTDWSPRITAVYDVQGNGKMLITGGAGRYYDWIPMALTEDFNQVGQGRKEYDSYFWTASTQDFDRLRRQQRLSSNIAGNTIDVSYKDEYTLGFEWAFSRNWAFKANALYWETEGNYSTYDQVIKEDPLVIAPLYENNPYAQSERNSLTLTLRKRFRNNWSMTANYTYSETKGTCYNVNNNLCWDSMGRLYHYTNEDGVPYSVVNRDGKLFNHLPHYFKLRGMYFMPLGKRHTLNLTGHMRYRSGRHWNLVGYTSDVNEDGDDILTYLERNGARNLDEVFQLDFSAAWRFPIFKVLEGSILVEVINITNEQTQTNVADAARLSGDPVRGLATAYIQSPRTIRALATLSF
jgi:hypothetical protein